MFNLFKNIRFYVLAFSILLSLGIFFFYRLTVPVSSQQILKITESYALLAYIYLYLALLASPFTRFFTFFPWRGHYLKARRAIGVSTFYFAFLHANFAFFGLLGGFDGLGFLNDKYLLAIILSGTALIILTLLASTSFDFVVEKLTFPRWKLLHRLIYLAGILILVHSFMLGTHFQDVLGIYSLILIVAIVFLLILESIRFDQYLQSKFPISPSFGLSFMLVIALVGFGVAYLLVPRNGAPLSFDIHSQHIQLAQQALQQNNQSNIPISQSSNPALVGDRNRRYTVSFIHPDSVLPNQDTQLKFRINDASSGNPVDLFQRLYAYPMHLIYVDSTLTTFVHIHPTQQSNEFIITTKFEKPGLYHLYVQYQPLGAIEQQSGFVLPVGVSENDPISPSTQPVDSNFTNIFGDYEVSLDTHGGLIASDMTLGKDTLTYSIIDAKTKQPITTLKPLMASFGHLTMINEKTYDFIHVHPTNLVAPPPDANGGPTVDFLPIGIYGPFRPGVYRVFGEFSTKIGTDFDTNFTVNVK